MGKIVRFKQKFWQRFRRWRRSGAALPSVLIVLLLGAIGAVEYSKFSAADVAGSSKIRLPNIIRLSTGAQPIVGRASVIDGDTIEMHGTRIRFYGIDAPESGQTCTVEGKPFRCGQRAALALADKIASNSISCEPKDRDRYGRVVAVCSEGVENLNAWMVANGWALAYRQYSSDYIDDEERASKGKLGIWQGEFVLPWDWRHQRQDHQTALPPSFKSISSKSTATQSCNIKGNISSTGERIYHVPSGEFYSRTTINSAKGERWFCSEAEAQAAGWRRSRR